MRAVEEIIIQAPADAVFNVVNDYEKWPEFLTVNKRVNFLKEENGLQYYEVLHSRGSKLVHSVCIRKIVNNRRIMFRLANPHFEFLKGEWIVETAATGTKLISLHDFKLKMPWVPGLIRKSIEYFLVKKSFFDKTTPVTLRELKKRAEEMERNSKAPA